MGRKRTRWIKRWGMIIFRRRHTDEVDLFVAVVVVDHFVVVGGV